MGFYKRWYWAHNARVRLKLLLLSCIFHSTPADDVISPGKSSEAISYHYYGLLYSSIYRYCTTPQKLLPEQESQFPSENLYKHLTQWLRVYCEGITQVRHLAFCSICPSLADRRILWPSANRQPWGWSVTKFLRVRVGPFQLECDPSQQTVYLSEQALDKEIWRVSCG